MTIGLVKNGGEIWGVTIALGVLVILILLLDPT